MSQRYYNKGGTEHPNTLIIKSVAVAKFVPDVCVFVNLAYIK